MKKGMAFTKFQHKNSYQAHSRSFLQSQNYKVKISEKGQNMAIYN